jgi:hypothetical protein
MKRWLGALAVLLVLGVSACSGDEGSTSTETLPTVVQSTTTTRPCGDADLAPGTSLDAGAIAEGDLSIYDAPGAGGAPSRTLPNPRLINNDPKAAVPLVLLVKDTPDTACDWVEVYLPMRPNGTTGFVKRADVTLTPNHYRIEIRLGEFNLKVFEDDQVKMDTKIAEAAENTPTPGGIYFTTELVKTPNPSGAYGPYAYGLSGFSEVLQTFNGGPGQLGIHGTNQPQLLGQKVSHGCIRMSNDDITTLAGILPLGVPVQIFA